MFHGVALRRVHAPRRALHRGRPGTSTCKSGGIGADAEPVDLYQCGVAAHTVVILYWVRNLARNPRCREKNMSILARAATLLALLLLSFVPAKAETWPNRPIKIIVSQAAGGTPDLIGRLISDKLSDLLGQRVVVENRPGGGNVVGAAAAAHAAADGYTLFFATAAALVSNPHTFKTLPYDPVKDFVRFPWWRRIRS